MNRFGERWLRRRYALWAPFYDPFVAPLRGARRRSIAGLALEPGERVLVVGAGTGLDLPLLPARVRVLAVDLTPEMLRRARARRRRSHRLAVMDARALALPDGAFDAAILHLILAVAPDPGRCLAEAARVVRRGGRLTVLDKFVPDGGRPSLLRRAVNLVTAPIATEVTRRLGDIVEASQAPLGRARDEHALGGLISIVLFERR